MFYSYGLGTSGAQQVGYTGGNVGPHAVLWSGTAASAVDLNPTNISGITFSIATSTNGVQQVGDGSGDSTGGDMHAMLWNGTAASAVDLNPTQLGIDISYAYGTSGNQQVGVGGDDALLWTGTAASAVDLNQSGHASVADGTDGTHQVGWVSGDSGGEHAALWSGTAASEVDLNPTVLPGINQSEAYAVNGNHQVGYGRRNSDGRNVALLWSGTADTAVNLKTLLASSGAWTDSTAFSINSAGQVFGTADGTYNGITGTFAVEWSPVPEPATTSMAVLIASGHANQIPHSVLDRVQTLTATIAAELGEAAQGGSHYRMLFVIGILLFIIAFAVNLTADLAVNGWRGRKRP